MMINKFLVSSLLLLFTLSVKAYSGIEVTLTDGTGMVITMSERPVITFSGDKLVVKTETGITELVRSKVKTFNYLTSSSVEELKVGDFKVSDTGDMLLFNNLPAGSEITVCDISGKLVKSATAEGNYRINVSDLSSDVYIVSVNGVSTKIVIKR
ncbi:MAG: T9SS type A sorting domain-containing protein [Bacteroidales bacterium]|nr:T9SS type A sorting domain-containing protein [Bacteroidales bacterium]